MQFQSTLPRRERRKQHFYARSGCNHFNPRSREGSDKHFQHLCPCHTISIHAPAKGATPFAFEKCLQSGISIHAPAKGATFAKYIWLITNRISIHAPAKGATLSCAGSVILCQISIHAPAKGATISTDAGRETRYFNPRSREGSDSIY